MFTRLIPIIILFSLGCSTLLFDNSNTAIYFAPSNIFKADKDLQFFLTKGINLADSCEEANICVELTEIKKMTNSLTYPTSNNKEEVIVFKLSLTFYDIAENDEQIVMAKKQVEEYSSYIIDESFHSAGDYEVAKVISKMKQNLASQVHDLSYKYAK